MNEFSAKTFQRKIEAFCQLRLSPVLKVDELHRLSDYLSFLIHARRPAPRIDGKTDWDAVAAASGIDAKELAANARRIDPALDAIARWIRDTRLSAAAAKPEVRKPAKTSRARARAAAPAVNHGRLFKALMTAHVPGWRSLEVYRVNRSRYL